VEGVDRRSHNRRWLLTAYAWTIVCAAVAFLAPVTSNNVSEPTPSGGLLPPARETLFTQSHGLIAMTGAMVVVTLAVGTIELIWRERHHHPARGVTTTIVASCLIAASVFGFIFGVLSLGVIGLFVVMSAAQLSPDSRSPLSRSAPTSS
jgi:hypothetical protein